MSIKKEQDIAEELKIVEESEKESCTGATEDGEKKELIAVLPVLFESGQYKPGDVLPTHNAEMVKAWIEYGAATWKKEVYVKAVSVTAPAGMTAISAPEMSEDDMTGKIPEKKDAQKGKKTK